MTDYFLQKHEYDFRQVKRGPGETRGGIHKHIFKEFRGNTEVRASESSLLSLLAKELVFWKSSRQPTTFAWKVHWLTLFDDTQNDKFKFLTFLLRLVCELLLWRRGGTMTSGSFFCQSQNRRTLAAAKMEIVVKYIWNYVIKFKHLPFLLRLVCKLPPLEKRRSDDFRQLFLP